MDRASSEPERDCGERASQASLVATSSDSKNGGGMFLGGADDHIQAILTQHCWTSR